DFVELIRKPVAPDIEYASDAIEEIYLWTAGNPYFTNIICQEVYQHCTLNKDAYVSRSEIEEAVSRKLQYIDVNTFHHWARSQKAATARAPSVSMARTRDEEP